MANLIPQHKAKLKQILETINYGGATFEQKKEQGQEYIKTFFTNTFDLFPNIIIFHKTKTSQVYDTAENLEINTYTIRVSNRFQDGKEGQESDIDELVSLITDALVNNYAKANDTWENLTNIKVDEYRSPENSTYFYKDITIDLWNTQTRTPTYL